MFVGMLCTSTLMHHNTIYRIRELVGVDHGAGGFTIFYGFSTFYIFFVSPQMKRGSFFNNFYKNIILWSMFSV